MGEAEFLARHGWSGAQQTPLAGDASSRRYTRLTQAGDRAILMDAGMGSGPALDRFAMLSRHLNSLGLSAPTILAEDRSRFLLLEDFGDAVFARVIKAKPELETKLYQTALDALIVGQNGPIPDGITRYGPTEMIDAIGLAFEWYPTPDWAYASLAIEDFKTELRAGLELHLTGPDVLIQRDFHAENLIWLPDRTGPARAGLLDFQDAVAGHPAYDVASLLVDARRDVSADLRRGMIDYYCAATRSPSDAFETAFALCSAQRNLRILGIFSRLAIQMNKPIYIDLIPRVWRNLQSDLRHPKLCVLRRMATEIIPEPTDAILTQIRSAHG